jgi:hypothetical protein
MPQECRDEGGAERLEQRAQSNQQRLIASAVTTAQHWQQQAEVRWVDQLAQVTRHCFPSVVGGALVWRERGWFERRT